MRRGKIDRTYDTHARAHTNALGCNPNEKEFSFSLSLFIRI